MKFGNLLTPAGSICLNLIVPKGAFSPAADSGQRAEHFAQGDLRIGESEATPSKVSPHSVIYPFISKLERNAWSNSKGSFDYLFEALCKFC